MNRTCARLVACIGLSAILWGCEADEKSVPSKSVPSTPPVPNANPPSRAAIAENRARLARIAKVAEDGVEGGEIGELIGFLEPVIPTPPCEVERLREGYSQEEAAKLLEAAGRDAWPLLLNAMHKESVSKAAFIILARQGRLEAFDTAFEVSGNDTLLHIMVLYLPYRGPTECVAMREWYFKNKEQLVYDRNLEFFVMKGELP